MVRRLTKQAAGRRALAFAALVGAVIVAHGCVAQGVAERMADVGAAAAMPQRIEVAYVREMAAAAPPAVAPRPVAAPPKPQPRKPREAAPPDLPASAPPLVVAEVSPEPIPEPAPPLPAPAPPQASAPVQTAEPALPESAASAPDPAASAPAPFAWPASTRLRYVLTGHYRGEINGSAQVEWVRQGERYQTHVDIVVGLSFAPLLSRRMSSEGRLTGQGLAPERYDEDSKVAFRDRRRLTMRFEPDAVVMPDGRRLERWPGVQDTASQFVQMTWMFTTNPALLTPGGTVDLALALPRNIDRWVYDVLQPETLYTPFGPVETFHLRPRRAARAGSDLTAEVWFAPSYRYLPVRIRIRQDADTFIDLMSTGRRNLNDPQETRMTYENILTAVHGDGPRQTGLITLNRPKQLNALNDALMDELCAAMQAFDADDGIGCIVITGSERAFAAGADIGAMATLSYMDAYKGDFITRNWEAVKSVRKPVIAAVAGFALGGGCELAMMCDFIIAADSAKFGQPEIKLGIIPGAGGTQRLPRAISKAKAMDMVLTSRMMDAAEAERAGLVSRVVPAAELMAVALAAAQTICEFSGPSIMMAKECVNRAYEGALADGIMFERRMFHSLFASEDQKEGMDAFVNKRKPVFKHR